MRILVLSFYYPPDLVPVALRAKSIVDALIEEGPSNLKIDVVTTMPNRYHSIKVFAPKYENENKISINRIVLPKHKNGMFDQVKKFGLFSFAGRKWGLKKEGKVEVATCTHLITERVAT